MNIRKDINKFAANEDKVILLWLFENYHMQSEWYFVAKHKYERRENGRFIIVWYPSEEGKILYNHYTQQKG